MKNTLSLLFFVMLIANTIANVELDRLTRLQKQQQLSKDLVIDTFIEKGNVKELFKVWHTIYNIGYDYNTDEGINRYKIFKENLKTILEHNRQNLDYKLGITEYSDKTVKELEIYFNIKDRTPEEFNQITKSFLSLDDYDDSQDNDPNPPQDESDLQKFAIDYTDDYTPIRNQGGCGSCYAFSTMGAVEGNYVAGNRIRDTPVEKVVLSTQQLVDCDYNPNGGGNWGCNGGWMKHANDYLKTNSPMLDADYPYKAKLGTCIYDSNKTSPVKVKGYQTPRKANGGVFQVLKKGPLAQCINVQSAFYSYKSGFYAPTCTSSCQHAIVLMGWGKEAGTPYWLARNSWGTSWGIGGYFKVKDTGINNYNSCLICDHRYSMRPKTN